MQALHSRGCVQASALWQERDTGVHVSLHAPSVLARRQATAEAEALRSAAADLERVRGEAADLRREQAALGRQAALVAPLTEEAEQLRWKVPPPPHCGSIL